MRAVRDHHVDRPEVEAGQPAQLTGTNRSIGFPRPRPAAKIIPGGTRVPPRRQAQPWLRRKPQGGKPPVQTTPAHNSLPADQTGRAGPRVKPGAALDRPLPRTDVRDRRVSRGFGRPGGHSEGHNTRSHPELGRENPLRRWYCASRRGRVGRRQAFQTRPPTRPSPGLDPGPILRRPRPAEASCGGLLKARLAALAFGATGVAPVASV